ncbi:MAG: PIN domain-containing protein [Opitutales bacterium]|nr:PIN domain-containing protein [Opitutales bacterium]
MTHINGEPVRGRVLLDTNVLIYATLRGDRRHVRAREILDLRAEAGVDVFVSVQNLAEMYPNLTGPKNKPPDSPQVARAKIRAVAALQGITVIPVTLQMNNRALELCELYGRIRQDYFDMQLVAAMQIEEIATILTENTPDFSGIDGIAAVNPFL